MKRAFLKIFILSIIFISAVSYSQQYNESNDFSYALKLFNEGFYDISAQQFSEFVNNYPNSDKLPDAKYYLAQALYRINDYANARIEFQSLAVTFPDYEKAPQAWKMVGELYLELGKQADAAKAFETVKVLYPDNPVAPQSMLKAAEAYIELNSFTQADRVLKEFLDRYVNSPEYPEGHLIYGKLLTKRGDFERAKNEFERAANLSKDKNISSKANLGVASVYHKLGLLNQAAKYYQNVIDINPNTTTALSAIVSLAEVYQDMGTWDQSISLLEKNRKNFVSSDDQLKLNLILAQSYFLKKDYLSARKILEKLLYSNTDSSTKQFIRFYLASCYMEEGKDNRAIEQYETILYEAAKDTIKPECIPISHINLVKLYLKSSNLPKARQYILAFHREYPNNHEAEKLHLALIKKAFDAGNLAIAVDELDRFTSEFSGSPLQDDVIYTAGNELFKSGDYDDSKQYFQKLIESFYCNENIDSALAKLKFINRYKSQEHGLGVAELARIVGKMLSGDEKIEVMLDLGVIYLRELKDYQAAVQIFEQCKSQSTDSSIVGKALYYLSESYMAQAKIAAFPNNPQNELAQKAIQNVKQAMEYIKYSPEPDSLMFRFLAWTIPKESSHSKKTLDFWMHFERSFPSSPLLPAARMRMAEISANIGDSAKALAYLDQIILDKSDRFMVGQAYWKKAMLYQKLGRSEAAIQTLKDFLLSSTQHPYEARAYWQLADYYAEKGDYASATKFLERLLQLYGYTEYAQKAPAKIVEYYISNGDYLTAFNYIQSQVKHITFYRDPVVSYYAPSANENFYFYAGKARHQLKEYQEARENIIKYLTLSKDQQYRAEAFYLLGEIASEEGNNESALMYFSLISNTDNPVFLNKANEIAADIQFKDGDFTEAQKKYESLVSNTSDVNKKIYFKAQQIRCLVAEGNSKQMRSELNNFQRQFKDHPEFKSYLASIEYEEGKKDYLNKNFDKALRHFSNILSKYKNSGYADDALYYQGLCYTTLNKTDNAMDKLTKFLKEYPNSPVLGDVYNTLANLYIRGEQTDLALGALQKAVETASTAESQKNAISNLIKLYKNLGMWDSALRLARQYVEKFPTAGDIIDQKILIGICLTNLNRYSEAAEYLKKTKFEATTEQEPEIQFYIGEAYFNAGRYEEAIGEFVKIPLLSKKTKLQWEASALYYSGQAYEKLARTDDAVRMYKEIVDRPGILIELKREAQRRIDFLTN